MNVQWNKFCCVLIAWCTSIQISSQCLSRYITPPIDGYSCQLAFYKNISDISSQSCVATCVSDGIWWTLSYNHPGMYCIVAHEACVSAETTPDFFMMVLRTNYTQPCVEWIPFSNSQGHQYGYPERAIIGFSAANRHGTVARALTGQKLLTRMSTTYAYKDYLSDSNGTPTVLTIGFDILVVHNQCSTTWMPYRAGDPIPTGAVASGSEISRDKYVIDPVGSPYVQYGSYTIGDTHGHYLNGGEIISCTNMSMLVTLLG